MNDNKIIKLNPVIKDYLWGGKWLKDHYGRTNDSGRIAESWELSVHPDGISTCNFGLLSEYLSKHPNLVDGNNSILPILIKYIDAKEKLSVQVHPTDEYATQIGIGNGKTEMWYIIEAMDGAGIYCGFKRKTNCEELLNAIQMGTVEDLLNFVPVKPGDTFLIESGTVHAICSGCVICEVQQNSNSTFRIYDYNRRDLDGNLRQLHIVDALKVINFDKYTLKSLHAEYSNCGNNKIRLLSKCKYFKSYELILSDIYVSQAKDSFVTVNVISGTGEISGIKFKDGDSFFVPYGSEFVLKGEAKILLTEE